MLAPVDFWRGVPIFWAGPPSSGRRGGLQPVALRRIREVGAMNGTAMNVLRNVLSAAVIGAAALAAVPAAAQASPSERNCFFITQWRGWSSPERDVLYLKVNMHDIYRVDLTPGGPYLKTPGDFLVSNVRGSANICSALDLDLAISDNHGFKTPLIARKLTKLTQAEAAAIPPKYRP
jgi:hypothetical protein